jgi:hypothetical protein
MKLSLLKGQSYRILSHDSHMDHKFCGDSALEDLCQ